MKLLLVEDDQFIRELYVRILSDLPVEIDTAQDGVEAYDKIHANSYNLILLDWFLPKMDGEAILEKLQVTDPEKRKSIVLLSNLDQDMTTSVATQGLKGYLVKNQYTPEKLKKQVERFLQGA